MARAVSKRERQLEASQEKEEREKRAVALACDCKNNGMTWETIVKVSGVPYGTIRNQMKGVPSIRTFNRQKAALTVTEEEILLQYVLISTDQGFAPSHERVRLAALQILEGRVGVGKGKLGKNWVDNFVTRHHRVLATHWSKPLDTSRADAVRKRL